MKNCFVYSNKPIDLSKDIIHRLQDLHDRKLLTKYCMYSDNGMINTLGNKKMYIPVQFTLKLCTKVELTNN